MSAESGLSTGRFIRTITLILFVTATFILVAAERLEGELFQIAVMAIGSVGFITAIIGFLIAASTFYDETGRTEA
jgi:hypothetical protein